MNFRNRYIAPLILLATVTLIVSVSVAKAQTATPQTYTPTIASSPSPLPSATPLLEATLVTLEKRVDELQEIPPKDVWDKINAISGLISGLVIAIVGGIATYVYREREIAHEKALKEREITVSEVQTVQSFMPQLQSGDEKAIEAALLAIAALGNTTLTTKLANLYQSNGAITAMSKIASGQDNVASQQAEQSLSFLEIRYVQRIAELMTLFNGQRVPGSLFSSHSDIVLPVITGIKKQETPNAEIMATGPTETWLVQIDFNLSFSVPEFMEHINWTQTKPENQKLWRIYAREGKATSRIPNMLISYLPDIKELEKILRLQS